MIRLGSLAGYPFEGPRLLAGWTPPTTAAVYAIAYKPEPDTRPDRPLAPDIAAVTEMVRGGVVVNAAEGVIGPLPWHVP